MAGNVPIRESVGAALRFVRENIRFIAVASVAGAAALTLIGGLNLVAPQFGFVTTIVSSVMQAMVYAVFLGASLFGSAEARTRWLNDGMRVWAAMAIIGFFLFIVMFVAFIIAGIVMAAGPLAPYMSDLTEAGSDEAAVMAVMVRFAEANPVAVLLFTLFFATIWMLLTSRLYLAAPATVDQQRILSFETWSWTKGAMLRITGARLLLLIPANLFVGAIGHLIGRLVDVDTLDPVTHAAAASSNPAGYLAFVFVTGVLTFALYSALEAGLSSYLYRGLKPAEAQTPPA
ncbi:MAG TPA: hypothetical protein VEF55_14285 [Candidatus Binatia bacterium]|nr:hypothetical protein [Candidatus Binatia bacterium]